MKIYTTHVAENITHPNLVVYTAAIKEDNPELIKAKELNLPCMDRATLLGEIMNKYGVTIACAGTHGKTTTTSMVTSILMEAGVKPTAHIGGILPAIGNSTLVGDRDYFITEACEYVESFLKFHPYIAVILNIEADHLDYFSGLEAVKNSFEKFTGNITPGGALIANGDDENVMGILPKVSKRVITYGLSNPKADWQGREITFDTFGCATFTVYHKETVFMHLTLSVPGIHNVSNALAAIAAAHTAFPALSCESITKAFGQFKGAARRFELKGIVGGIRVVDDYAHHPTEIKATLHAAKEGHQGHVWCVFQPHTYTRTKALLMDFSDAFELADTIIITDIYAAREKDPGDVHARMLVDLLRQKGKNVDYISTFSDIVSHLEYSAKPGDLILTMGAGNVDTVADMFIQDKFEKALN